MAERRLAAVPLLQESTLSQSEIARTLGVSRQSVCRWARQLDASGKPGLAPRRHTGRPSYLSAEQWQMVLATLRNGAQAAGFPTERWTLSRIAQVIEKQFGVHYNANYLSVRLHSLGWSVQVPDVTARERNEELVQA